MPDSFEITTVSARQTRALAETLSDYLLPGDLLVLSGDLGAGKTCFTQGLATGLGVKEHINSPTFTIIHEHSGRLPLYHFDLYRLETPEQLEALGYEDYFFGFGVTVIEWGDKMPEFLPEDYLTIEFHRSPLEESVRTLEAVPRGGRGLELAKKIGSIARQLKLKVVEKVTGK